MKLYNNNCYEWDDLYLGMAKGLICEARCLLEDDGNSKYDDILANIDETCLDDSAVNLIVKAGYAYNKVAKMRMGTDYEEEEGFDLFFDLYFGDSPYYEADSELKEFYHTYSKLFDKTPSIGESVDGDIRVFFE